MTTAAHVQDAVAELTAELHHAEFSSPSRPNASKPSMPKSAGYWRSGGTEAVDAWAAPSNLMPQRSQTTAAAERDPSS